jgi:hypothetical protein
MPDLVVALVLSSLFSALLWAIELQHRSKAQFRRCINGAAGLYFLILLTGSTATTLFAAATTASLFAENAAAEAQQPIKKLVLNLPWFWYAFLGVFGFSVLLKNMNVTFFRQGVLSINDWISKALERAVASAVKAQATANFHTAERMAGKLRALPEADLNAHVLNALGMARLKQLEKEARTTGADVALTKALALA